MIKKIFNKNINKLHTMNSMEGLGWSLVGIYIPIYLKIIGYSWEHVFIYFIIQNTGILFASFLVAYIGRKTSLQKILIIRFPFLFIFLLFLFLLETKNIPFYCVAVFDGLQSGLYWLPMHILFSRFTDDENVDNETGKLFAIPQFISMFGPLIGGFISLYFGFSYLFGIGFMIFVISFIPILFANVKKIEYDFKFREGVDLYKKYPKA